MMKISYRTHPALSLLEKKELAIMYDAKDAPYWDELNLIFPPRFNAFVLSGDYSKVFHVANSFYDAARLSVDKLLNNAMLLNIAGESGTLLIGDLTIFFKINKTPKGTVICEHVAFTNCTSNGSVALASFSLPDDKPSRHRLFHSGLIPYTNHKSPALIFSCTIMNILLFKKYAEVEFRFLPASQKIKDVSCKYVNETKIGISFLDSKWFTTLVKSDAFKVRGHFRLQPCGEGLKDKKLIWINDFVKDGYTAPARKLSADL